jgi:MFS transporter, DHA1 family, tetracycline resistance protein
VPAADRPATPAGFWPIWFTVALDLIGFGMVVPILALYAERFGASTVEVGLILSTFSLAQFVAAPLLGAWSDRVGRKPVIIVSLIGTAVGSVITGAAGALWVLYLGRLIDGGSGGSLGVARAAVADMAPVGPRERLLGLLGAAFGVGFVIGPALGWLALQIGPSAPFYLAAALAAVNAVVAWVRIPETRPRAGEVIEIHGARPWLAPLTPTLARWALIGFVVTFAFVAFEATFSLFANRRFDLDERGVALVFLAIGVLLVVVQGGVYGRLVGRVGPAAMLRVGLGLVAAGMCALAAASEWWLMVVAVGLLGVGQAIASPSISALVAAEARPDQRGRVMGTQEASSALARVVGPVAATTLFGQVSIVSPFLVAAALTAGSLALASGWRLLQVQARQTGPS